MIFAIASSRRLPVTTLKNFSVIGPKSAFFRSAAMACSCVSALKTFLFNAAFLPQFIQTTDGLNSGVGQTVLEQFMILSLLYLLILAAIDCCWVVFASFMRKLLRKYKGYLGVFSAACLFASAAIIATIRR
jgi:threonine/homoserine/homoserine lactone efflux protein